MEVAPGRVVIRFFFKDSIAKPAPEDRPTFSVPDGAALRALVLSGGTAERPLTASELKLAEAVALRLPVYGDAFDVAGDELMFRVWLHPPSTP